MKMIMRMIFTKASAGLCRRKHDDDDDAGYDNDDGDNDNDDDDDDDATRLALNTGTVSRCCALISI